jgi:hypothetical protein
VVQFMPDGGRAEAANTGVLLFVPERRMIESRVSDSLERVRQFFRPGRQELRRIELALEAFKHRMELARSEIETEAELAQFAAARADSIRLTAPRLMMTSNPYSDLDALYEELVGDRQRSLAVAAMRAHSIPRPVAEVFGRLEAERRVWRPGRILLPTINKEFEVPIAYRNGRVNYVRPESLSAARLDERLAKLGFTGQLIYKHPVDNQQGQLVVLSSDENANPFVEDRFERTLQEFHVRFVRYDKAMDFANEVEKTAH